MNLFLLTIEGGEAVADAAASGGGAGGFFSMNMILIWVALIAVMWLLSRPQKKKEKALKELQNAIEVGDEVLLHCGIYGTVSDIYDDCLILDFGTNKTVRIPVVRSAIAGKQSPNMTQNKLEEEKKES